MKLRTQHLDRGIRELYFPYRHTFVVQYVRNNPAALIKMLQAETAIVNGILNFAVDVQTIGLEVGVDLLRRRLETHLRRFSGEFNLAGHAVELIQICTGELWKLRMPATQNVTASYETTSC
jgi:hypothetical protein